MTQKLKPVSISMPESLIVESRVEAARRNMSRSAFVVQLLREALQEGRQQQRGQQRGGQQQSEAK